MHEVEAVPHSAGNVRSTILALWALSIVIGLAPPRASGEQDFNGLTIYYGHLHNHCGISDGSGTAAQAYETAKGAGMDFFGLSDHAYAMSAAEFQEMQDAATAYDTDPTFTTFWGFEWSSTYHGHVTVVNATEYTTASDSTTDTFSEFLSWIDSHSGVAFFNHPGRQDGTGQEFGHFLDEPSSSFVGMELWNKDAGFNTYYYPGGYTTDSRDRSSWFDEALYEGWTIGAAGSQDHHGTDWGGSPRWRLAIIAGSNTRTSLYAALQERCFYSTLDENLMLSFTVDGLEMGNKDVPSGAGTECMVTAGDADGETFVEVEIIQNGYIVHTEPLSNVANPVVTCYLDTAPGDYIYCKVTQTDGDEAISSPVFIDPDGPDGPPRADLSVPLDNGPDDFDSAEDSVTVNTTAPSFKIQLTDTYEGVDDATVEASDVSIAGLISGTDYSFVHDAANDIITLTSLADTGLFENGTYTITVSDIGDKAVPSETMAPTTLTVVIDTTLVSPETVAFQQNVDGYTSAIDTMIHSGYPDTSYAGETVITPDSSDSGVSQALLRFDGIIGEGAGQIPLYAIVTSATLRLQSLDNGNGGQLHAMLQSWPSNPTWNSLGDGVSTDNSEAAETADDGVGSNSFAKVDLDVTATVQQWVDGDMANNGWVILAGGTDGWDIASAEYATASYRPELVVTFIASGDRPPLAEAGEDQVVCDTDNSGTEEVTLDGSASYDPGNPGATLVYVWAIPDYPYEIPASAIVTVDLPVGEHVATLTVYDEDYFSDTDTATITVNANMLPTAEAGSDLTIDDLANDGWESVSLDGSLSSDSDGYIASYQWIVDGQTVDDPEGDGIVTVMLAIGTHVAQLTVTDDGGDTDADTVSITVQVPSLFSENFESGGFTAGNWTASPQASVETTSAHSGTYGTLLKKVSSIETLVSSGNAQSVTFRYWAATAGLKSGSEFLYVQWSADGNTWSTLNELTGTNGYASFSQTIASPPASFWIRFATNGSGGNDLAMIDDIAITGGLAVNQPPVANAGNDQTVSDGDGNGSETVTLDASGSSDSDGTIVSYVWTENGTEIATGPSADVSLTVGVHTIILTVTDDDNAATVDTVTIEVTAAGANQSPIADAGVDQTVTDADDNGSEVVTLNGSASNDPDGTIDTYVWTESGVQIAIGSTPSVTLTVGVHIITLTVTDDDNAASTASVTITVNAPAPTSVTVSTSVRIESINPVKDRCVAMITVRDDLGGISGAIVTGHFTGQDYNNNTSYASIPTNSEGYVEIWSDDMAKTPSSAGFEVTSVSLNGTVIWQP